MNCGRVVKGLDDLRILDRDILCSRPLASFNPFDQITGTPLLCLIVRLWAYEDGQKKVIGGLLLKKKFYFTLHTAILYQVWKLSQCFTHFGLKDLTRPWMVKVRLGLFKINTYKITALQVWQTLLNRSVDRTKELCRGFWVEVHRSLIVHSFFYAW